MSTVFNVPVGEQTLPRAAPARGYTELSHFGLIRVFGADAESFLQGQFSCDIKGLAMGRAQYGSYNTPKGRMLASFLMWRDDTGYSMQLPRVLCTSICKRLSMYILRSKVSAQDVSEETCAFGVAGEFDEAPLPPLFAGLSSIPLSVATHGASTMLRIDARRVQVFAPVARARELSVELGAQFPGITPESWDLINIRAGIPFVMPSTQDQFVPQMANLDLIGAVSFSKGCYPGQEIVARMHYLGKLKQRMYLANITSDRAPQAGDKLYSAHTGEQAAGMIVNAAPAPEGGYDVLAVIQITSFDSGGVHLNSPDGPLLTFMKLPYDTNLTRP